MFNHVASIHSIYCYTVFNPYHHIIYYDLGQDIILQYAKTIKANMNTNCISLINSIIFQNVSSHPPDKKLSITFTVHI